MKDLLPIIICLKFQGPELIKFATAIESFMTLESGRVDALVAAQNTVKPFLDHYGAEKFFIVSQFLEPPMNMRWQFPKNIQSF